jgi:hypothetical protein
MQPPSPKDYKHCKKTLSKKHFNKNTSNFVIAHTWKNFFGADVKTKVVGKTLKW